MSEEGVPPEQAPSWFTEAQREVWTRWTAAIAQWRQAHEAPSGEDLADLAEGLDVQELLGFVAPDVIAEPSLGAFLGAMEDAVAASDRTPGRLLAVPRLLRASVAEARGDMPSYRALLESALEADPDNREALVDLADLHAIAGEALEADRLYRRGGLPPDSDELKALEPFLHPPADGPGRNRPCPCGSGKKYKVCHGRTAVHPLEQRARWLWTKLCMFAQRSPQRADLLHWGGVLAGAEPGSSEAARQALGNPMVHDFAIVDGGLLAKFLTVMGELLPADELALAQSWEGRPMRLLEVRRVLPMRGIVATDLLTREELEIADRRLSREVEPRDVLLGRPLDDGSRTLRLQTSPALVPRTSRARLLELLRAGGAPRELAAAVFVPVRPIVQTTGGEEMVFCTARYDVPALDQTWGLMAGRLDDDPELTTLHRLSEDDTVLGTVSRRAGRLVLETNAVERLRALQAILLEVDPQARLVDESMEPLDALADRASDDPDAAEADQPQLRPEDFAAMARRYQDRWLDDSIPVLGGETPRQAARSSRREDLIALLDDFEWQQRRSPTPFDMDVDGLRRELGIEG
ncbi:MAG TPA: SEC-C domain-containing protein [Nocardioides sp.]|nr:SEC-C domain-containing protein [Nocardioides sp.]